MSRPSISRHLWVTSLAVLALLLAASSLGSPASAATGPWPQTRDGFYVGFGVGGGSAAVTLDNLSSDRETAGAGSFRAGYVLSPKVGFGLESNAWRKEEGGVTVSFSTATAAVSYYPAEGLVLRGGLGLGTLKASLGEGSTSVTASKSGLGVTAGAAYEFRIMRTLALGPQLDYSYVSTDKFNANYLNLQVGLTWYFIPAK